MRLPPPPTPRNTQCALRNDSAIGCWGRNWDGQTTVPPAFATGITQISVGDYHTCALHKSTKMACWGEGSSGKTQLPPSLAGGGVVAISAGGDFTCAILAAGRTLVCFGANYNNELDIPAKWKKGVAQVAAGAWGGRASARRAHASPCAAVGAASCDRNAPSQAQTTHARSPLLASWGAGEQRASGGRRRWLGWGCRRRC